MDAHCAELSRVTHHIERAESYAARQDVAELAPVQRLVRHLLLSALAEYRAAGQFPINRGLAERTPTFVDASGTRCAMAHLLELGGEGALVEQIARERNHARVRELVDDPRLRAWLVAAGLTAAEAAAIQPAYDSVTSECICGGDFSHIEYPVPALGVLEGVVLASGRARIERTYGDAPGFNGDEIALAASYPVGTRILAPIDAALIEAAPEAGYGSIALDGDAVYRCTSQGVRNAPDLDAEQFAQAVLANDCAAHLAERDTAWAKRSDGGPVVDDDGGGCSVGGGEAASIGVLLALVATLVHRSRRARLS